MRQHPLPDWLLERYRLGELPARQDEEVRRALADDAQTRARLEALEASDRQILDAHPPGPAEAAIRLRAGARTGPAADRAHLPRWLLAAPALAAALVLAVVVGHPGGDAVPIAGVAGVAEDGVRAKGLRPRLIAYRVAGGRAEALGDGAAVRPGDTLQLAYVSAGRRYGVVVSVDGRGQVTLHLPAPDGPASATLEAQREVALPRAYQLDDAPAFERFFLVTSASPFQTDPALAAARALGSSAEVATGLLALPAGLDQTTLSLRKVTP